MIPLAALCQIPAHLAALQLLVERCDTAEAKKALIVTAGACEAISPDEGSLLITAYQLETA